MIFNYFNIPGKDLSMEYEKIKEWLDLLVEDFKRNNEHADFNSQIYTCHSRDAVHMCRGIEIVANVMGLELRRKDLPYEEYSHESYFIYNDVRFFQMYRKDDKDV